MVDYVICNYSDLQDMADAIRTRDGIEGQIDFNDMKEDICNRVSGQLLPLWDDVNKRYEYFPYTRFQMAGIISKNTATNSDGKKVSSHLYLGYRLFFDQQYQSRVDELMAAKDSDGNSLCRLTPYFELTYSNKNNAMLIVISKKTVTQFGELQDSGKIFTLNMYDVHDDLPIGESISARVAFSSECGVLKFSDNTKTFTQAEQA